MSEIKSSDLGQFEKIQTDVEGVSKAFKDLVNSMDSVITTGKELDSTLKSSVTTRKQLTTVSEKASKNAKDLEQSTKKYNTVQVKSAKSESLYFKELKKSNKEKEKAEKAEQRKAKQIERGGKATLKSIGREGLYFKELKKANKEKEKAEKVTRKKAKQEREHQEALNLVVKSEADAARQNKALRKERSKLDKTTEEGLQKSREINEQIEENIALSRQEIDSDQERTNNIGNYQSALEGLPDVLQGAAGGFTRFTAGIQGATKAALKFILTPIGAIIAALVVVVGAVVAAFRTFQPLMDKVSRVTAGFGAVVDVLKATLAQLGDLIIKSVVVGFLKLRKGILQTQIAFNKFRGNDEKVKELGETLNKVSEELDYATASLQNSADKTADSFKNIGENAIEAAKAAMQIRALEQAAERVAINNIKANAELNKQREVLSRIADDATRSFEERERAANKLLSVEEKLALNKIAETKIREEAARRQLEEDNRIGKATNDQIKLYNEAAAARIQAETEAESAIKDSEKRISELKQDRLERDLDFEVDIIDKRLQAVLGFAAKESESIEDRQAKVNEFAKVYDDAVARQVGIIEQFTNKKIDLDELQNESDISVLTQKVRSLGLSEIIEGRLLEILRDRSDALRDLNDTEKELSEDAIEQKRKEAEEKKKLQKEEFDAFVKGIDKTNERLFKGYDERLIELNNLFAEGKISQEEYNKEVASLSDRLLNRQINNLSTLLLNQNLTDEERIEAEKRLTELQIEESNRATDKKLENLEKERAFRRQVADESRNLGNELFNFNTTLNNRELANLEAKKEAGLLTEEQFAEKSAEINKKQAIADKAQALFNIAINTYQAISKAVEASPVTGGLPFSAIAAAIGAAQAAAVLAEPIPEFDKGAEKTPKDYIAGEKRPELRKSKGKWSLVTEPTLFTDSYGDKIIGGAETSNILTAGLMDSIKLNKVEDKSIRELRDIKNAIQRSKTAVNFNKNGIQTIYNQQRFKETRIDKYIS